MRNQPTTQTTNNSASSSENHIVGFATSPPPSSAQSSILIPSSAMSAQSTLQQFLLNTVAAQQKNNSFSTTNPSSSSSSSGVIPSSLSISSTTNNNNNIGDISCGGGTNSANLFSNMIDSTITKNIPMNNNSNNSNITIADSNNLASLSSFYNPMNNNNQNNLNSLLNNPSLNSILRQQLQQQQQSNLLGIDMLNSKSCTNTPYNNLASSPPSNSLQFINQQQGFNSNSSDVGFLSTSTSSNSSSSNSNLTPSPTNLSLRHSPPFSSPNVNIITNNNNTMNTMNNNQINLMNDINNQQPTIPNNMTNTNNNNTTTSGLNKISKKNLKSSSTTCNPITMTSFNPYPVTTKPMNENSANGKQLMFIEENGKTKVSSSTLLQSSSDQFEISCTSCRAKHRKCSKELPTCSYCLARGITCIYRKPKKKGRQGKQIEDQSMDSNLLLDMSSYGLNEMNSQIMNNNYNESNNMFTMIGNPIIPSSNDNNFIPYQLNSYQQEMQQQEFQNASSIEPFDPNNWINQIRSSLQTNDNSNDINMLHSLLTSDSINNIFSLTNLMENNHSTTTNSTITNQPQQPQPQPQHTYSINDLTDELMKRLTLEDYCKSTSFPVIDKSEVSSLLQGEKRTLEATALLYSIHALMCQRKGLKHEAESACNQARNILSRVFDKYNDFLIACAYCNLSVYSSGEGNLAEAKFYLKFVDYYFENEATSETNNVVRVNNFNLKMLKTVAEMSAGIAAHDVDSNPLGIDSEKKEIGNLLIGFYKLCTGEKKAPQPLLDIVSKTVTSDTLKLYLTLLELVSKLFYQHEMERNLSNEHSEISQRVVNSFIHGTRVLILQECGISSGTIIEESANRLINISCEDNYGTAYSVLLCAIAAACRVHLKIVRDIKKGIRINNGEDGIDYFEMIKKGLKALTLFSTRYGRVHKLYRSLIMELQEVEKEHSGFKLCLLATKEIERLKLKKLSPNLTIDVPLLSKDDILSIYYLVAPEQ